MSSVVTPATSAFFPPALAGSDVPDGCFSFAIRTESNEPVPATMAVRYGKSGGSFW
ncbi:MAG: hypothetical protein IPH54_10090 [Rhodoferax sp.]|nr:hypothetical protein [Rhodoferax sp.]